MLTNYTRIIECVYCNMFKYAARYRQSIMHIVRVCNV